MNEQQLYEWCVKQAVLRKTGQLEQWQIFKLDALGFDWKHYEKEADRLAKEYEGAKNGN